MSTRSEPLVSVVMPFLNTPVTFMREAVESVLAQSYQNWELLLVDDGSRGDCVQVAQEYARQFPERIQYLEHEGHRTRGISASRNLGLHRARGEYMAVLDADDLWLPSKLTEQLTILHSVPAAGSVYGRTLYWFGWSGKPEDQSRDYIPALGVPPNSVVESPRFVADMISGAVTVPCTCSLLVRRVVVEKIGGFEEAFTGMFEDQVFYTKVFLAAPVYAADACWDKYRRHSESLCATVSPDGAGAARRKFLQWVRAYLLHTGIAADSVQQAVGRSLWELDHPYGARILRSGRRARRWGGRLTTWIANPLT